MAPDAAGRPTGPALASTAATTRPARATVSPARRSRRGGRTVARRRALGHRPPRPSIGASSSRSTSHPQVAGLQRGRGPAALEATICPPALVRVERGRRCAHVRQWPARPAARGGAAAPPGMAGHDAASRRASRSSRRASVSVSRARTPRVRAISSRMAASAGSASSRALMNGVVAARGAHGALLLGLRRASRARASAASARVPSPPRHGLLRASRWRPASARTPAGATAASARPRPAPAAGPGAPRWRTPGWCPAGRWSGGRSG